MRFALVYNTGKSAKSIAKVRFCELFCLLMITVIRLESSPQKVTLRTSHEGNRSSCVQVANKNTTVETWRQAAFILITDSNFWNFRT
jgi:hypothetical protein